MTVYENLEMGSYLNRSEFEDNLARVYDLFPLLSERRKQLAGRCREASSRWSRWAER